MKNVFKQKKGISISMLSGNNGILQKATDAKINTEKANEKEQIQLAVFGSYNNNAQLEVETVNLNIKNNISGLTTDDATEFPLTVTYTATGNSYTVDEYGNVNKAVVYPIVSNTLKTGDYVEYNDKPYIVLYDMDSEYNWVEIISLDPLESITLGKTDSTAGAVGTTNTYERAKWSYNNAISTLNAIAQNYLNTDLAEGARCVGSNPINPLSEGSIRSYDKIKEIDNNYQTDYTQLQNINVAPFSDSTYDYYWLASRGDDGIHADNSYYGIKRVSKTGVVKISISQNNVGFLLDTWGVIYEELDEYERERYDFHFFECTAGFRPIIKLKSSTKVVSGDGSSGSPYKLQK